MKKLVLICLALLVAAPMAMARKYPSRDITNVVVWGAGGGTDVCNRVVSAEMAAILGVNINVVNKPGGVAGSLGMAEAYGMKHDGYTICGLSESCVTAGVQGGWDKKMDVWYPFIVAGSPDVISVTPDSPYKTLKEFLDAAKAAPKTIKAGAGGSGSIHHLNLLALEKGSGAAFNFIPYPGSAPSQNAAMTGEINCVVTSLAEQAQLIRGGKLRPLAMLTPDGFTIDAISIPSAFTDYPGLSQYLPIMQAIGMAVPAGAPDEVKAVLSDAFTKALATEKVQQWAKDNYYVINGKTGEEASKEFAKLESLFAWTLLELNTTKVSPEALGIPKP
jgi:tripartite-type tricarboxylate transporter receptor subunit TctC